MKYRTITIIFIMSIAVFLGGCTALPTDTSESVSTEGLLSSTEDIDLHDTDGRGMYYVFTYGGEEFRAQYGYDCWTVYDSYRITNENDITIICQALIDTNPVHGADMESYRTADDMAYEWEQHNLAYTYLPEDNAWMECAKNVDLDPQDQGRSFKEIYENRTGEEFDVSEYIKERLDNGTLMEDLQQFLQ